MKMVWTNPDLTVYHGTDLASANAILKPSSNFSHSVSVRISRKSLDFGQGFYVTTILEQSIAWANKRKIYLAEKNPEQDYIAAVVKFTISRNEIAKINDLVFISSVDRSHYWDFVKHCRRKKNPGAGRTEPYGAVYGPVSKFPKKDTYPQMDQIGLHTEEALALLKNAAIFKQGTPLI